MLYRSNKIYVDDSSVHGRGVFCSETIKKGEILEECHFIKIPSELEYPEILFNHLYSWPKRGEGLCVCLGFGSIYNHSDFEFSADWETDTQKNKIIFFALREITPGEEIFTNYQKPGNI
jgi:SET domain-containing protein